MVLAVDFSGLNAWADALATILLIELCVLLLLIAALMLVLALGARWLQMHVVPLLNTTVPVAKQALEVANQSTDRVVHGVAEVYGVRRAVETATRILLFGKDGGSKAQVSSQVTQAAASAPTETTANPTVEPRRTAPRARRSGSPERRTPPLGLEPGQASQPHDDVAAHAG
jgi:hypothetical protein